MADLVQEAVGNDGRVKALCEALCTRFIEQEQRLVEDGALNLRGDIDVIIVDGMQALRENLRVKGYAIFFCFIPEPLGGVACRAAAAVLLVYQNGKTSSLLAPACGARPKKRFIRLKNRSFSSLVGSAFRRSAIRRARSAAASFWASISAFIAS